MRVAVLYSGFLRSWQTCKPNQQARLGIDNHDLYFFSPEEPKDTIYKQYIKDYHISYYPQHVPDYDHNINPITKLNGSLNQWHVNFINFNLVPMDYDCYVKCRTDIEVSGNIDFAQYEMKDNTIYIPSGNDHCDGCNDHMVFGNFQSMKKYLSIYLNHGKLFAQGKTFHTEYYVTENLKMLGVEIVRIEPTTIIIRQDNPTVFSTQTKWIRSEYPKDHWGMLSIKGKRVLDCGCGRNWEGFPNTIQFFIEEGASEVHGVEMSPSEEAWYGQNAPDAKIYTDQITTSEQLLHYFDLVKPQIVKMDIEGYETVLCGLRTADYNGIEEIAIEYHDQDRKHLIETHYQLWGFNHIDLYKLQNFDTNEQGVIHIRK